jgi:tellurite resistance protein
MASPSSNLSSNEMGLLQVVCYMAWVDGELSAEEKDLLLSKFSQLFANSSEEKQNLHQELQNYVAQPLSGNLETSVAQLQSEEDRELALKLSYMMIRAGQPSATESGINASEKLAYRRLVELLDLQPETIEKVEWAADTELSNSNVVDVVTASLKNFFDRLRG